MFNSIEDTLCWDANSRLAGQKCSLPCSHGAGTNLYPGSRERNPHPYLTYFLKSVLTLSSYLCLRLVFSLFPSGFLAFHISLTLATCTAYINTFWDITFCHDRSCTKLAIYRLADRSSILGMVFSSLILPPPDFGLSQTHIRLIPWVKRPKRTGISTSQLENGSSLNSFCYRNFMQQNL